MDNQNKKSSKVLSLILKIVFCLICVGYIVLVVMRAKIFTEDTLFYNMYNADYATNGIVRLLKSAFVLAIVVVICEASVLIVLFSNVIKDNRVKTITLLIGNLLKYAAFIYLIFAILSICGVDTTVIATGAGVIALIIGLGCESLISDIVSGIFMLFEGDIKVGDVVVVNDWRGTVLQIGLRRTKIEDAVGNVNIINNSAISNIINNTKDLSVAACDVGIEYNESIEKVEALLAKNFDKIKKDIPDIVEGPFYKGVSKLDESSVVLKIVAKAKEENVYQVQRDLNRAIKLLFDDNDINIPFNQLVVTNKYEDAKKNEATSSEVRTAKKFVETQKDISKGIDSQDEENQ